MPVAMAGKGIAAAVPAAHNGVFSTGNYYADCTGRIALQPGVFLMLRGYDEVDVFGTGHQDVDLRQRLAAFAQNPTLVPAAVPGAGAAAVPPLFVSPAKGPEAEASGRLGDCEFRHRCARGSRERRSGLLRCEGACPVQACICERTCRRTAADWPLGEASARVSQQ